jgi:hypothetical protein
MTPVQEMESEHADLSRFPELNPSPLLACGLDAVQRYANPAASQLLQTLDAGNLDDILPVRHKELVKTCLLTGTALTEKRTVAQRTLVWSYRADRNSGIVYVYGHDISEHLSYLSDPEDLPRTHPDPVLLSGSDGVPRFANSATSPGGES